MCEAEIRIQKTLFQMDIDRGKGIIDFGAIERNLKGEPCNHDGEEQ